MKRADLNKHGFDGNSILEFCKKNIRYISASVIVVLLILVLTVVVGNKNTTDKENQEQETVAEQEVVQMEGFEENVISEINTLIENYYAACAAGDTAKVETYATPITDTERDYITLMSQYVSGYKNIECHTKPGLGADEYAVSVEMNMCFENVETNAPGLDFFYVRKNSQGEYYIDNLYSQFNLQNQEQPLDSQVEEFINLYETQEDMLALCVDVEKRYAEAMEADEDLKNIAEVVIPTAIQNWVAEITGTGEEGTTEQSASEETPTEVTEETQVNAEQVYVTENVNVRKEADENAEKVGSAVAGQALNRLETLDNGWSKIEYDGVKAYIKSEYLSMEKPVIEEESETEEITVDYVPQGIEITLNSAMNVRETMDENGERLGTAEIGDKVEVVLSYAEGWTKVKWQDKTGYIKTELLLNN